MKGLLACQLMKGTMLKLEGHAACNIRPVYICLRVKTGSMHDNGERLNGLFGQGQTESTGDVEGSEQR